MICKILEINSLLSIATEKSVSLLEFPLRRYGLPQRDYSGQMGISDRELRITFSCSERKSI